MRLKPVSDQSFLVDTPQLLKVPPRSPETRPQDRGGWCLRASLSEKSEVVIGLLGGAQPEIFQVGRALFDQFLPSASEGSDTSMSKGNKLKLPVLSPRG